MPLPLPTDLSRLLVTGGEGMIGRAVPFGVKLSRRELDVTHGEQVEQKVSEINPAAILHLAAIDMHRAESDPRAATETNVLGTYNLALAARRLRIPLVFLSSGAVFHGQEGEVHDEDSRPSPRNIYGQTKWLAEILLGEMLDRLLIVRTGWVFGGHQSHHRKFVDLAIEKALAGEPIEATSDHWGSPTFVKDLISELERLISSGHHGLIHVVNEGVANGMEIATEIVQLLGSRSRILPTKTGSGSEVLKSRQCFLRPWREALKEYVFSKEAQKR